MIACSRNLFAVVVLGGLYSFLMATVLVAMDAVDVAMTEASVGAGISTVLFLSALYLCKSEETQARAQAMAAAGGVDRQSVPCWSTARSGCRSSPTRKAPIHVHVVPRYLNEIKTRSRCARTS